MGIIVKFVSKNPNTGRLDYRRVFPAALRLHIPSQPKQLKRSLKANDINAPGALDRYHEAHAEYERLVALAVKKRDRSFDVLDAPKVAYLAAIFENEWRKEADSIRWQGADAKSRQDAGVDEWLDEFRTWSTEGDLTEVHERWRGDAEALLERQQIVLDPSDLDRLDPLCIALNEAAISVCEAIQKGRQGKLKVVPDTPLPNSSSKSATIGGLSFDSRVRSYMENPRLQVSPSVRQGNRTALRFFKEAHGEPVPDAISRTLVSEWLDLISKRPTRLPKAQLSMPIRQLVERYKGHPEVPRMSPKTQRQHISSLSKCWKDLASEGRISVELQNPFAGHRMAKPVPSSATKGFATEELQAIFRLPIFTQGERPRAGKGEACFWIPLILLWTGARPEEVAQLLVDDVFKDAITGVWLIRFTNEGRHPHKGPQVLKTGEAGRRTFPVPKVLLDLNLPDYLAHLEATGEVALFPKLRTRGERNVLFAGFSEWWSNHLQEAQILPKDRRASREFRHVWATAARASGIPQDARMYIMGHKNPQTEISDRYGVATPLGNHIQKLEFPDLDLSKILPWGHSWSSTKES